MMKVNPAMVNGDLVGTLHPNLTTSKVGPWTQVG